MKTKTQNQHHTESQLITLAQGGNAVAFESLILPHEGVLRSFVFGMVRNQSDTDDVTQQTLIKAWKNIRNFSGKCKFYTWLHRIAVNSSINLINRRKPNVSLDEEGFESPKVLTTNETADKELARKELASKIEKAVESLSPDHQTVVRQFFVLGLSHEEIAQDQKIPTGTVRSQLHYARKKLQASLSDERDAFLGV